MQNELTKITRGETNDYIQLIESILAIRSLKIILKENPNIKIETNISDECLLKINYITKDSYNKLNNWWELIVFCKHFLDKIAKHFWTLLHVQIGQNCNAYGWQRTYQPRAIADII